MIRADLRDTAAVPSQPTTRALLDCSRPVAVPRAAVLPIVTTDAKAHRLTGKLREALPSGGYPLIAHAASEAIPPEPRDRVLQRYSHVTNPIEPRSHVGVAAYVGGLEPLPPGVVLAPPGKPEDPSDPFPDEPERSSNRVGMGRKPSWRVGGKCSDLS